MMLLELRQNALSEFVLRKRSARHKYSLKMGHGGEWSRSGTYIRARSVVEGCHDFIEKGKIEFFVKVEDALHRDSG